MIGTIKRDSPLRGESLFVFTVLVIGVSGIIAQITLLRELLISFYGNELTLGLILTSWMISEAIGVFVIGRCIDRVKNRTNLFIILQIIFALTLPLAIYFCRIFKNVLGIPFGEGLRLSVVFYSSFFIMLAVGFCHGGLFSCTCEIYSSYIKESARSIGKIYTWETVGTIIGGIILTYVFLPRLSSFQIAFIILIANLFICLLFLKGACRSLGQVTLFLFLVSLSLFLTGQAGKLDRLSVVRQWIGQEVLEYRNSIYGNITVTKKEEQSTFFYNGIPTISLPYPDITFVREFGNLPLLFHPKPKNLLIIGGGAGGLINEALKYPIKKIDYTELDPLIIAMLQKHASRLVQKELNDPRVNIINTDGRFFVRNTLNKYDVILIGLSKPADLATNRLFTQELFSLVKRRLHRGGILALYLPGSLTYLSDQLRDINGCILNGLNNTFGHIRIIPGDYNIFLASDSDYVMGVSPDLITQKIEELGIKTDILVPAYLDYRLDKKWTEWFRESLEGATKKINRDFTPFAVFETLVLWNKQFSPAFSPILESMGNLDLRSIAIAVSLITFILFLLLYFRRNLKKITITYSIATTGFFAMLINLVLIFSFQVTYGYLYHKIGLLMSIFMAGIAAGSIFMTNRIEKIKSNLSLFMQLEAAIILFTYLAALAITGFMGYMNLLPLVFTGLFFISGLLMGLEFPLASKIYLGESTQIGKVAGLLYFSDLVGGCIAGIFGGVIFLPVLGLFNTCVVIVFLKLSSLLLLGVFGKRC